MRRLTSTGVALVLVVLASAVLPVAASAAAFAAENTNGQPLDAAVVKEGETIRFAAENTDGPQPFDHTILAGAQGTTHVFTAGGGFGGIACTTATLAGTSATGTDTEISLAPTYAGCKDTFGRAVHPSVNGCSYEFHPTTGSGSTFTGDWDIACPGGKTMEMKITSGGSTVCTVTIGTQEGIAPIHFENMPGEGESPTDLTVGFEATNLKNTTAGGFFNCGVSNGAHSNGTYDGSSTVTAETTGLPEPFEHTIFYGVQVGNFLFSAGKGFGAIACNTSTFAGTSATGTETELSLFPTYAGCTDVYGRTTHIATNGCSYEFHPTAGSANTFTGDWDIVCEAGKAIEWKITSGGSTVCTATVGAQEGLGPIHFENMPPAKGSPADLTMGFEATNLKTTTAGIFGGAFCEIPNGAHSDGTYTGNTTITAENTNEQPLDVAVLPE